MSSMPRRSLTDTGIKTVRSHSLTEAEREAILEVFDVPVMDSLKTSNG